LHLFSLDHFLSLSQWNFYQILIHGFVLGFILYFLTRPKYKPEEPLSSKEISEIINDWKPEALYPKLTELMLLNNQVPVITGTTATHSEVGGRSVLNLAKQNFLGFMGHSAIESAATSTLYKYGTGTCGPRGFYGTIDVHLELEKKIKTFLNAEDCIIYAYGFSTISSAIPAFSGRGDLLIVDKGCNYAIQTGLTLARAEVKWFNHNDVKDLERILQEVQQETKAGKRKLTRRFIVIEGVYFNYGDLAPLPQIVALKKKYAYRLFMDDSYGVCLLGSTGKGTTQHFGLNVTDVEILTGALDSTVSSVGGFCCGNPHIIYHQRLNGTGYVYSASLPPLLTVAAKAGFDFLESNPSLLTELHKKIELFYKGLNKLGQGFMRVRSVPPSPVLHWELDPSYASSLSRLEQEKKLQELVDLALTKDLLLTRAKYVESEAFLPPPSIRFSVSVAHSNSQLEEALQILATLIPLVFSSASSSSSPVTEEKPRKRSTKG